MASITRLVFGVLGPLILAATGGLGHEAAGRSVMAGPDDAEIALIRRMEEDRVQAGVRKDVDAIAAVTAEDYLQIDFDGKVRDKAAAMQRIRSAEIRLQSNAVDDMVVRIYGNTAVVTGRSTPKGTLRSGDFGGVERDE
jgi:ketosteroid isomerase-like protein